MNLSNVKFFGRSLAMIAAATVIFGPRALANPLKAYCISQVGQKWEEKEQPVDEPPSVSVTVLGETFHVTASSSYLDITRPEEETRLARVEAKQNLFSRIEALALGKDGWLWIDGHEIDYMARLDLSSKPPTFEKLVKLSKLKGEPCPLWVDFLCGLLLWGCSLAQGTWSPTLNRAFISGHPVTLFGRSNPVGFEVIAGESKPLPTELKDARFLADLPKLNGVLFRGSSNEAFFYDGATVTTLLGSYPPDIHPWGDYRLTWHHQSTLGERTFLISIRRSEKHDVFLMELKAGPILVPISFPDELANNWLDLFA
ncbi:MAG: hypothetical protein GDA44_07155, partial [Prochloron sp. SP5CPC1]|nr:hypothetical protein [Candidatus Paraprochloron terpiosi SP5CPC1]